MPLKLNSKKRLAALKHFKKLSDRHESNTSSFCHLEKSEIFRAKTFFLFFAGCVAFGGQHFMSSEDLGLQLGFLVFLFSPFYYLCFAFLDWQYTESRYSEIKAMEDKFSASVNTETTSDVFHFHKSISFEGIRFSYPGATNTALSIRNLEIPKGKIVFVTGGNGGGKSTFLKVLTGLYDSTGGRIKVDGKPIGAHRRQAYRELFASVFTDFHLDEFSLEGESFLSSRNWPAIILKGLSVLLFLALALLGNEQDPTQIFKVLAALLLLLNSLSSVLGQSNRVYSVLHPLKTYRTRCPN